MTNAQIAAVFDEIADILEFQGANPFRVRAYRNAARTVRDHPQSMESIVADPAQSLTDIDGVGAELAAKIVGLIQDGEIPMLTELRAEVPQSVLTLMRVAGVGPKKAALLYKELRIADLDQLQAACEAGRVREIKGFGAKTEQAILEGLKFARNEPVRMYWAEADAYVQEILKHLQAHRDVEQLAVAGSYRRGKETVGDLDFLVVSSRSDAVMDHLAAYGSGPELLARGDTKMSIRIPAGLQVDLRVVPAESFGAALQYFTGSKEHNVILRGLAKDRGLKINEYGVYRGDKYVAGKAEVDVYAALDLPCFPPELREGRREFQWAAEGKLPELVELSDLQGDLHMHTTATDGSASIEEMAAAAWARGLKYIAITDHSKRVSMARGLDGARLLAQWAEVDRYNATHKDVVVLKGIECDILEKGGLDLPDDVLAEADWVVCSVHYGQNQPREQITGRILEALANPHVDAIAHPTGRLINRRKSYEVDLERVIAAAAEYGKILELNANPARLDLDDVACAAAKAKGVPIVISSDAHSTEGLAVLRYGILQARRGGLTKVDVVNTLPLAQLRKLLKR